MGVSCHTVEFDFVVVVDFIFLRRFFFFFFLFVFFALLGLDRWKEKNFLRWSFVRFTRLRWACELRYSQSPTINILHLRAFIGLAFVPCRKLITSKRPCFCTDSHPHTISKQGPTLYAQSKQRHPATPKTYRIFDVIRWWLAMC